MKKVASGRGDVKGPNGEWSAIKTNLVPVWLETTVQEVHRK